MSVSLPEETTANVTIDALITADSSNPKEYLTEICDLLQSAEREKLIKIVSSSGSIVTLLHVCANEKELGQKILAELARATPKILKQFVDHELLTDLNPVIRMMCVECIYDLIDNCESLAEAKEEKITEKLEPRRSSVRFSDSWMVGRKSLPINSLLLQSEDVKSESVLLLSSEGKSNSTEREEGRNSINIGLGDMKAIEEEDILLPPRMILGGSELLPFSSVFLNGAISEDVAPELDKHKGSSKWFIRDVDKVSSNSLLLNLEVNEESSSEEEAVNILSPSEKDRHEREWFESFRGSQSLLPELPTELRPSILKNESWYSRHSDSSVFYKIADSPRRAFMYNLEKFRVLIALSDLATLDPLPKSRDLAKRTIALLLERAPSGLLQRIPDKFGKFSRVFRQLKLRPASRPIHLRTKARARMNEIYSGLVGRTLVVGEKSGVFSERLVSYFHGHCGSKARELIITLENEALKQIARYPGFADTFQKLSQCSNVNFEEEKEVKVFDPEEMPTSLSTIFISKKSFATSPVIIFGVDPTKLGSKDHFQDSQFNTVIWNILDSDDKKSYNKDSVASFLESVVDILHPNGCIHISFSDQGDDADQYEKWGLDEVVKEASFCLVATKKFPTFLYKKCIPYNRCNGKATIYVLKPLGIGAVERSEAETFSDDTYSEQSS